MDSQLPKIKNGVARILKKQGLSFLVKGGPSFYWINFREEIKMKRYHWDQIKVSKIGLLIILLVSFVLVSSNGSCEEKVKFIRELKAGIEKPVDVAVSPSGDVYILDESSSEISVFSKEGKLKITFGEKGSQLGQMYKPKTIALTREGDVVVADTGNSRVQVFRPSGEFSYELGNEGSVEGQFKSPSDVVVDMLGYIYVVDDRTNKLLRFSPHGAFLSERQIEEKPRDIVFDVEQYMYLLFNESGRIVKYPDGSDIAADITVRDADGYNPLYYAVALSVDERGDIYIIENNRNKIVKIDQEGKTLFSFGSRGVGRGQFDMPQNITSASMDQILIADAKNKRVQMMQVSGSSKGYLESVKYISPILDYESSIYTGENIVDIRFVKKKGLYSLSDGSGRILLKGDDEALIAKSDENSLGMNGPKTIYVYDDGKMIVADTGNHRIQFLNEDGTSQYCFGKRGKNASEFNSPQGVAVSKDGYIYVSDTKNHRIQVFSEEGIYLNSFGKLTEVVGELGPEPGTFFMPKDIEFDDKDQLYVLDYRNRRIQVFDKEGNVIRIIGSTLNELEFKEPVDFTLDENGYLYVADKGASKVYILDDKWNYVMEFGSAGKGPSYFPNLTSIESYNGKIYVSDYMADSIKVFSFDPFIEEQEERVFITRVFPMLNLKSSTPEIKQKMTQNMALKRIQQEVSESFNLDIDGVENIIKVEAEEVLSDGNVSITISVPKIIADRNIDQLSKK